MAENIDDLVQELYDKFRGLPNTNSIVRNSQPNDAYTVAILKLLYSQDMNIDIEPSNIDQICQYIVAPQDGGIDLFIERESGDAYYYDIIQAKYSELDENTNMLSGNERCCKEVLEGCKECCSKLAKSNGGNKFL